MGLFDTAWLVALVSLSLPILLTATGEVVAERTGIFNIGLDGMMIAGAFSGFLVTWLTGSILAGVIGGALGGMTLAVIVGLVSIVGSGNQVVVGTGVWIIGVGATSFLYARIFSQGQQVVVPRMEPYAIPVLSEIPVIGPALFNQIPLAYVAFVAVGVVWFVFRFTNWGLIIRSAGEAPAAVDNAGVNVSAVRWFGVLFAGAMAGLGGTVLTIGSSGTFTPNVTAGQGFIALTAVFFGRWNPIGAMLACFMFGGASALQLRLQTLSGVPSEVWLLIALIPLVAAVIVRWRRKRALSRTTMIVVGLIAVIAGTLAIIAPPILVPTQFWLSVPYIVTLVVLAGVAGASRGPASLGVHYQRAI